MNLRRIASASIAVAALVMMSAASGASATQSSDRRAIQGLLARRAEAVMDGDRAAFMATLARSSPAFVKRQGAVFDRLQRLPLASLRYVVAWHRFGDLVRPSDVRRYPAADDVAIPLTEERYRIEGFDREEAVEDSYLTFVKQDGEWLVAEDTDLDDMTFYSGRHLWDFGPVAETRSRHFLLLRHPCEERSCEASHDYLTLAERGLQRVGAYWPDLPRRTVVLVPDTQAELARLIQATFELDDFVAFAYSTVDLSEGIDYTGHRVILNPDAFEGRASETVLSILAHEMLHVATRESAGPFVPIFVDEGWADFVGNDADPASLAFFNSEVASGVFSGQLPEDFEFSVGTGTDIYRSYQESQSAVRFFVERYGSERFVRFYKDLGSRQIAVGTVRYHVDRAMRRATGSGLEAFERAWADSIAG